MKAWKKLSLVLCLTMAFSGIATACGGNETESSSSAPTQNSSSSSTTNNNSSTTDDSSSSSSGSEEDMDKYMIDLYLGIVASTLKESQSAKLTFTFETTTTASATDGVGSLGGWTNYKLTGDALVTKTEEGFDAKLNVELPSKENKGETETRGYYYIDGYTYLYNEETKKYEKHTEKIGELLSNEIHSATEGQYTLEELLAGMVGGGGIVGGDMNMSDMTYDKLEESLGKYAVIESEITDTGLLVTADASKETDKIFDFLRTVNKNTTYGQLLNFPLSYIDEELTTDAILQELYPRGKDKVSDFVKELEEKSVAETGKTLQKNLEEILKNEVVQELLASMSPEMAESIKGFKIDTFLKEDSSILDDEGVAIKNGDLTLNKISQEFVKLLVEAMGEDNPILEELGLLSKNVNWGLVVGAVEMVLDWKAFEGIPEDSEFYDVLEKAQQIYADTADVSFELKVGQAVESFLINGVFGGKASSDGKEATIGGTISVGITEFSKVAIPITLPEDAEIVVTYHACETCEESKEDVSYRKDVYGYYCDDCYLLLP